MSRDRELFIFICGFFFFQDHDVCVKCARSGQGGGGKLLLQANLIQR